MRRIARLVILSCLVALILAMGATTSLATTPSGSSAQFTYRATLDPYHFDSNDFKIFQKDRQDIVMRQLTLAPGGSAGWHFHPGPSFVIVTQGTLSLYQASDPTCTAQRFGPGEGFVEAPGEDHVHIARNEGTTPLVIVITFLDVPIGRPFRLDAPAPQPDNCSF